MDLFSGKEGKKPLAVRMRPTTLSEVLGQEQITGPKALLPKLIEKNEFGSLIFTGDPGCGKTSIAEVIARQTNSRFVRLNATLTSLKELRSALEEAKLFPDQVTTLFIDEIHRFSKSEQDVLLPYVEDGVVRLIGATTHNPAFYVIPPLLSRSHLFKLSPVRPEVVVQLLRVALTSPKGLKGDFKASDKILLDLARLSQGDVRQGMNALEAITASKAAGDTITEDDLKTFANERRLRYDGDEDGHYDAISAYIKSCRGSDPDAALYWLFRMLNAGEDPRYILRRLFVLASEDVGLADNKALPLVSAALNSVELIGMPEAKFSIAHATIYVALAPKSNTITTAIERAEAFLIEHPDLKITSYLADDHYKRPNYVGAEKDIEYLYSHDFPDNVSGQSYLPIRTSLYEGKPIGEEKSLSELNTHRKMLRKSLQAENPSLKAY